MKHLLYILIGMSFLGACTGTPDAHFPRYSDFPDTRSLHAQVVHPDTVLLRYPFRVAVCEGVAVVMDLHPADCFLHAFTYPGWKHIASLGNRGEAPGELQSVAAIRFNSLDSLWALDAGKMQITRWKISPSTGSAERVYCQLASAANNQACRLILSYLS